MGGVIGGGRNGEVGDREGGGELGRWGWCGGGAGAPRERRQGKGIGQRGGRSSTVRVVRQHAQLTPPIWGEGEPDRVFGLSCRGIPAPEGIPEEHKRTASTG